MGKIQERIAQIKLQRQVVQNGEFNIIPWHFHFPRLATQIPGLIPKKITTLFAATGAGEHKL